MNSVTRKNNFRQTLPFIFLAFWALLLLANFVPALPQPGVVIGYLWKVEFFLAAFLFVGLIFTIKFADKFALQIGRNEFLWIVLPIFLFTIWSGISLFWAESARNAVHHTLLWACYLIFYLMMRQIAAIPRFLNISLAVSGVVVFILGTVCISEYLTTSAEMSGNVSLRYSKYAEAIAALLVLFAAIAIQKRNRNSTLCGAVALVGWLAIVFSLGRTQFIAGLFGILVFGILALIKSKSQINAKKITFFAILLLIATVFSQISFTKNPQQTTLKRLSGDEHSQMSFQVRILVWQIAFESFKQNPLIGTGAESFGNNYQTARKKYAETNLNDKNLAFYEEILPERAHNEFLQISAELGLIGIIFFSWLLFGILRNFFFAQKPKVSLLSIAAFAGICIFLVSSLASSYSFRVPANGLCFFFLLAVLSSKIKTSDTQKAGTWNFAFGTLNLKTIAALLICAAMISFSVLRGVSLMYLEKASKSSDETETEFYFQKALVLDSENELFRYYYGVELYNAKQPKQAIPHLRFGIDRGIATSIAYFNLSSAQIVAKQRDEAEKTLVESLEIYPRSVFLRTAYADILEENGNQKEALNQYEKASEINAEQARSWRIAFKEGMGKLSQTEFADKQFVKTMDLRPTEAIYALLDFQRQFRPNLVRR